MRVPAFFLSFVAFDTEQLDEPSIIEFSVKRFMATLETQQLISQDQLDAFLSIISDDPGLQSRIRLASCQDDVVAISKEAGYLLATETLLNDVSDLELECGRTQVNKIAYAVMDNATSYNDTYCCQSRSTYCN